MRSRTDRVMIDRLEEVRELGKRGRYPAAMRILNTLGGAYDISARLERVRLLADVGNYADAWTAGRDLLDRKLADIDLVVLRGEIRLALGQISPALADGEHAVGLDENHAPAWSLLAGALQAAGDRDVAAQQALRKALDLDPCDLSGLGRIDILPAEQVTAPLRALRCRPDDATVVAYAGILLVFSGEVDKAQSVINSALSLDPQRWEPRLAETFLTAAEGRLEDTIRAANVLLAELDCAWVRVARALVLMPEARLEEALADLNEALTQMPGNVDLLFARATVHSLRQDWPATLSDTSRALDLRPASTEIRLLRARARVALASPDLALGDVTQLLAVDPGNAEALTLRAHISLLRGDTHAALRDAEAAMTAEVTIEPLLVRGLALAMLGRTTEAHSSFLAVLRLDSGNELAARFLAEERQAPAYRWSKVAKNVLSIAASIVSIGATIAGFG